MESPSNPYAAPGSIAVIDRPQDLATVEVGNGIVLMHPVELMRQVQPFVENATQLLEQANRAVIDSDAKYQKGTEFLSTCTQQWDLIEELRKKAKVPVDEFSKFIQNQCTPSQGSLTTAKAAVSKLMLAYRQKVAKKLAEAAEASGNTGLASAIVDAAAAAPAPTRYAAPIGGARTNSMGRSTNVAMTWVGSAADPMALLAAIIKGIVPISCIEWKQGELNKAAKTIGVEGTFNGLKVEKAESLRQR